MKHVLIVDDDEDLGLTVAELLESQGFRVTRATSGQQGLRYLDTSPPDIILLDYMMPEMSGYEFCQAQRTRPDASHIPVVLFTAARDSPELEAIAPDAILRKPCTFHDLLATLTDLCAPDGRQRP